MDIYILPSSYSVMFKPDADINEKEKAIKLPEKNKIKKRLPRFFPFHNTQKAVHPVVNVKWGDGWIDRWTHGSGGI